MVPGRCYDILMSPFERWGLARARARLLSPLRGDILDLGAGTGANFPYFHDLCRVVAVEPHPEMRRTAQKRAPTGVRVLDCSGELLTLPDNSVDHVVATLVFCSVDDLTRCLAEIARVLRPAGSLHFLEHIRGQGLVARLHDLCTPIWSRLAGGCHLNRRTVSLIREAGFETCSEQTVLRFLGTPFVAGVAEHKGLP